MSNAQQLSPFTFFGSGARPSKLRQEDDGIYGYDGYWFGPLCEADLDAARPWDTVWIYDEARKGYVKRD